MLAAGLDAAGAPSYAVTSGAAGRRAGQRARRPKWTCPTRQANPTRGRAGPRRAEMAGGDCSRRKASAAGAGRPVPRNRPFHSDRPTVCHVVVVEDHKGVPANSTYQSRNGACQLRGAEPLRSIARQGGVSRARRRTAAIVNSRESRRPGSVRQHEDVVRAGHRGRLEPSPQRSVPRTALDDSPDSGRHGRPPRPLGVEARVPGRRGCIEAGLPAGPRIELRVGFGGGGVVPGRWNGRPRAAHSARNGDVESTTRT